MSESTTISAHIAGIPLHDSASAKVKELSDRYSDMLIAQAKVIAHQSGAVQVSPAHIESAYHRLRQSSSNARAEAAKLFSGAIFGVGITLLSVTLPANPVNVLVTVLGIAACVIGVGMMGWLAGTQR